MNWLRLHRLIQKDVCLNTILLVPAKLHHSAASVKTWLYHLALATTMRDCFYCGIMNEVTIPTVLTSVLVEKCVVITHRYVCVTFIGRIKLWWRIPKVFPLKFTKLFIPICHYSKLFSSKQSKQLISLLFYLAGVFHYTVTSCASHLCVGVATYKMPIL